MDMTSAAPARKIGRPVDPTLPGRRRTEILAVSRRVFAERGYRNTDVKEIADALNVGKGTIYRYFFSKEKLFLATVDAAMEELSEALLTEADRHEEPLVCLKAVVVVYLQHFDRNPDLAELIIHERAEFRDREQPTYHMHRDRRKSRWHDSLQKLVAEAFTRPGLDTEQLFDTLANLLYGTMFTNVFNGRIKSVEQQANELLDIYLHGILKMENNDPHQE